MAYIYSAPPLLSSHLLQHQDERQPGPAVKEKASLAILVSTKGVRNEYFLRGQERVQPFSIHRG